MKRPQESATGGTIPDRRQSGNMPVERRLRVFDRTQRHAVLATVSDDRPYTSLVAFALLPDLSGALFATPRDTFKYRNILRNGQVALLIDNRSNRSTSYMEAEAITILGKAVPVRRGRRWKELSAVFTAKHFDLAGFISSPRTALVLVEADRYLHVGHFQTVSQWKVG
jgi:hypothetical protein